MNRTSLAALGLILGACSSSPTTPPDTTMGSSAVLAGTFQVRLVAPVAATPDTPAVPGFTSVVGRVSDGPSPSLIVWEDARKDGACTLRKPRVPLCNTPCGSSAACVENDKCQAYPTARSVGKVKVTGLKTSSGASEFTMEPIANNYQIPAGVSCPYPAFADGAAVRLDAEGGAYAAFTLQSTGISPFALTNDTVRLDPNTALKLTWTAGAAATKAKVHVKLDISHHGGTKGMIECDSDDTGSVELSAALVTDLLNLGVAGFPTVVVSRSTAGSAVIAPGRVDLVVVSDVEREVKIAGLTSCSSDDECPMGQKCQPDLRCQ